jgi:hypothetical protein
MATAVAIVLLSCASPSDEAASHDSSASMPASEAVEGRAPIAPAVAPPAQDAITAESLQVTVYKTPTCGCCRAWVDHLRDAGFHVETVDRDDLTMVKSANGVPERLASCHTATVGDYVVEGHVPAEDIRRLLRERPAVAGLAVPGMPVGSPGMEVPGRPADRYDVLSFDRAGVTSVFASH